MNREELIEDAGKTLAGVHVQQMRRHPTEAPAYYEHFKSDFDQMAAAAVDAVLSAVADDLEAFHREELQDFHDASGDRLAYHEMSYLGGIEATFRRVRALIEEGKNDD